MYGHPFISESSYFVEGFGAGSALNYKQNHSKPLSTEISCSLVRLPLGTWTVSTSCNFQRCENKVGLLSTQMEYQTALKQSGDGDSQHRGVTLTRVWAESIKRGSVKEQGTRNYRSGQHHGTLEGRGTNKKRA